MDKISVNNLFNLKDDFRPLSVDNLKGHTNETKQIKPELNFQKMIEHRKEKENKILEQYEKIYNICLNKINVANTHNRTQTVCEIASTVYGHTNYKLADCMLYVINKLESQNLDVIILQNSIYISWEHVV